jgi:hypothetical protein
MSLFVNKSERKKEKRKIGSLCIIKNNFLDLLDDRMFYTTIFIIHD